MYKEEVTRSSKKLPYYWVRIMWFSYKHSQFFSLIKKGRLWCNSRSLALTYIIKSKAEPATVTIKRPLELISSYSFNLYYMKGKYMILSDFLSRQQYDDSNPHEIIPIYFNMHNLLYEKYYNIGKSEKYLVQMQPQRRSSRIKLLDIHGVRIWIVTSNQNNRILDP